MNINCLACKWQYPGQECFDRKFDLFEEDMENTEDETPYEYWKGSELLLSGATII